MKIVLLVMTNGDSTVYDTAKWISSVQFSLCCFVFASQTFLFLLCFYDFQFELTPFSGHSNVHWMSFYITCVLISRTSSINDWVRPPLKPSKHRIPSDVIEIFVIVQLCTWSGRPEINIHLKFWFRIIFNWTIGVIRMRSLFHQIILLSYSEKSTTVHIVNMTVTLFPERYIVAYIYAMTEASNFLPLDIWI